MTEKNKRMIMLRISKWDWITLYQGQRPERISGNYLSSHASFLLLSSVDIVVSIFSTLGIIFPVIYDWPSPWPFGITNIMAAILYVFCAFIGLIVGFYLLHRYKRRLEEQGSIRVSVKNVVLVLSPPFFVVSTVLDFLVSLILADFSIPWGYLFYGPGLGLLIARLLYFVYESRHWKLKSVPSREPSVFPQVGSYVISKE
ncbi:MAG: hypothetical protein KGY80_03745 [Candidatus Thorarchaeota archaeon]|nr:hypothetical protein [Candidatus Thorarchaeota archaeon]